MSKRSVSTRTGRTRLLSFGEAIALVRQRLNASREVTTSNRQVFPTATTPLATRMQPDRERERRLRGDWLTYRQTRPRFERTE